MSVFDKRVAGIEKLTLLDFPGKVACILFYNGCRTCTCPYCYNKDLWKGKPSLAKDATEVMDFLSSRGGKIDGVVFSGGECTLWGDALMEDIEWCRERGFSIKLDTNGTNPELVEKLLKDGLVDYIALDVKCPESKWKSFYPKRELYDAFHRTLDLLLVKEASFETRTTIHPDIITEDDASEIFRNLKTAGYHGTHYLQFFFNNGESTYLDPNINKDPRPFDLSKVHTYGISTALRNGRGNTIGEIASA